MQRRSFVQAMVGSAAVVALSSCTPGTLGQEESTTVIPDEPNQGEVVREWFAYVLDVAEIEGLQPAQASRFFAYMTWAIDRATRFSTALPPLEAAEVTLSSASDTPTELDFTLVVASVVKYAAPLLVGTMSPAGWATVENLWRIVRVGRGQAGVHDDVAQRSIAWAAESVAAVAGWAQSDGAAQAMLMPHQPLSEEGAWTVPAGSVAEAPMMAMVRPILVPDAAELLADTPHPFSTAFDSPCYLDALEVYQLSMALTDEEIVVARYWSDGRYMSATPPGHWVSISLQLARERGDEGASTLEMLRALTMTLSDASISCFTSKYRYYAIRPDAYIQTWIDSSWKPLLTTPPHPESPSGHSVYSSAAVVVLEHFFDPEEQVQDTVRSAMPLDFPSSRQWPNLRAAAVEAGESRILGGIHFRRAVQTGATLGASVARRALEELGYS